jgi:hypothetical protein
VKRAARNVLATLAWLGAVLFGAMALAHWAACEQDDAVCAFTGSPR